MSEYAAPDDAMVHSAGEMRELEAELAEARAQIAAMEYGDATQADNARLRYELAEARAQIAALAARHEKALVEGAARLAERDEARAQISDMQGHVDHADAYHSAMEKAEKERDEARAQIAAKDAALQECLLWFDNSDLPKSDMQMIAMIREALTAPAQETT